MPRKRPGVERGGVSFEESDLPDQIELDDFEGYPDDDSGLSDEVEFLKAEALAEEFGRNPTPSRALAIADIYLKWRVQEPAAHYLTKAVELDGRFEKSLQQRAQWLEFRDPAAASLIYSVLIELFGEDPYNSRVKHTLDENIKRDELEFEVSRQRRKERSRKIIQELNEEDIKWKNLVPAFHFVEKHCGHASPEDKNSAAEIISIIISLTDSNDSVYLSQLFAALKQKIGIGGTVARSLDANDLETFQLASRANVWTAESGILASDHIVEHFEPWFGRGLSIEDIQQAQPELIAAYKIEIVRNPRKRIRALTKPYRLPSGTVRPTSRKLVAEISNEEQEERRRKGRIYQQRYRQKQSPKPR